MKHSDTVNSKTERFKKKELLSFSTATKFTKDEVRHYNVMFYQKFINQTLQEDQS